MRVVTKVVKIPCVIALGIRSPAAIVTCIRGRHVALPLLAAKGVNLNSICATSSKGGKKAVLVYTVEAAAKAKAASA